MGEFICVDVSESASNFPAEQPRDPLVDDHVPPSGTEKQSARRQTMKSIHHFISFF